MHWINPSFDKMVILPPYNNLWAQVVKRGNPPEIVTEGLTVEYRIEGNTYSYGKAQYGTFWDGAAQKLACPAPAENIGLTGNGLSGVFKPRTGTSSQTAFRSFPSWTQGRGTLPDRGRYR